MRDQRAAPHVCHADGCQTAIAPRFFMCRRHWHRLAREHQEAILAHYGPGQERDKRATLEYLAAAKAAIASLNGSQTAPTP